MTGLSYGVLWCNFPISVDFYYHPCRKLIEPILWRKEVSFKLNHFVFSTFSKTTVVLEIPTRYLSLCPWPITVILLRLSIWNMLHNFAKSGVSWNITRFSCDFYTNFQFSFICKCTIPSMMLYNIIQSYIFSKYEIKALSCGYRHMPYSYRQNWLAVYYHGFRCWNKFPCLRMSVPYALKLKLMSCNRFTPKWSPICA